MWLVLSSVVRGHTAHTHTQIHTICSPFYLSASLAFIAVISRYVAAAVVFCLFSCRTYVPGRFCGDGGHVVAFCPPPKYPSHTHTARIHASHRAIYIITGFALLACDPQLCTADTHILWRIIGFYCCGTYAHRAYARTHTVLSLPSRCDMPASIG